MASSMAVVFAAVVGLGLVFTLLIAHQMEAARMDREFEATLRELKQVRMGLTRTPSGAATGVDSPPPTTPQLEKLIATQMPTSKSTKRPTFIPTVAPTFTSTFAPTHQKLPTVHSAFALEVFNLASNLALPKLAVFNTKLYHYYGGKEQLKRYFKLRKWKVQFKSINASTTANNNIVR
ncbi:hypothetical protein BASA82_000085 [Batrachochytrium salamandrivorans]|nr:hypothetical protein BASA82_000085 [Batrachochytrium salamandrivorans]